MENNINKTEQKIIKANNFKDLVIGVTMYTSGSILGPLIILAAMGYYLDKMFGTKPIILIISIFLAFIITNILIYKKVATLNRKFEEYLKSKKSKKR